MEDNLHLLFQRVHKTMETGANESLDEEAQQKLVEDIDQCDLLVRREALFSKNETLDDVHTGSLKFLFLSYYKAKVLLAMKDMKHRRSNLMFAKEAMTYFLQRCLEYNLLHESEVKQVENVPMSADEKRTAKIEKFKREKAAKARMGELSRLLAIVRDDNEVDHEEEQRELFILSLQSFSRECIDELALIDEEMKMLVIREEQMALEEARQGSRDGKPRSTENKPGSHPESLPFGTVTLDPNRPGISVTKTYKVGDQLMMSRETVKVFGTHIAPPTMTLEEFGDLQLADAMDRAQREAEAPPGPRRYNQLVKDGDEDDPALLDEATVEDRRWDDWKDNNPKGWGNKAGKRF